MADLIVGDDSPRRQYTAAALQTVFAYPFPIFANGDLKVYLTPVGQDPDDAADLLTLTTDYTVSDAGDSNGGDVTLVSAASSGDIVTIVRDLPVERTSDFQTAGDLLAETVNDDLDKLVMMVQQVEDFMQNRSLLFQDTEDLSAISALMPSPVADGLLKWNSAANALQAVALSTLDPTAVAVSAFVETLLDDATAEDARSTLLIKDTHVGEAGGTVDAITSTCAPAVGSLYDGAIVSLMAAGANTSATVTFAPNGLTAKNIKRAGNQALRIGDIPRADYECFLKYNSTNDVWELINPAAHSVYVNNTDGSPTVHDSGLGGMGIEGELTKATYEVVGPTGGAGNDYTFTDLDDIPDDVDWIEVKIRMDLTEDNGSANGTLSGEVRARDKGATATDGNQLTIAACGARLSSGGFGGCVSVTVSRIPVTNRQFEMYWTNNLNGSGTFQPGESELYLTGYGYNN